jgi:hypothetical protein
MKIFFEVELEDDTYINFEDLMSRVDNDEALKTKVSIPKYKNTIGIVGRVTIQFYKHTFIIEDEFIPRVLLSSYVNAATNIFTEKRYQQTLERLYKDKIVCDYSDVFKNGIRIRQQTHKDYVNDAEENIFCSNNFVIQEIIVPKKEFIEQTIICSEQYFSLLEKVEFNYPYLESWRKIVNDLKEQFARSEVFMQ